MVQFKVLDQRAECYNHDKFEKQESLYEGGDHIIKYAHLFIPKNSAERDPAYIERLKSASYINYFAEIVDYYAANLFSKELSVVPAADATDKSTIGTTISDEQFYRSFSSNADLKGNALSTVLKKCFTNCLIYGCAYVGIDFPKLDVQPDSLAEEDALGVSRAYLYEIENDNLINYEFDDFGKLRWCVLKKTLIPQDGPFASREFKKIQFKVWTLENTAKWQLFEITAKINKDPNPKDDVQLIEEGITSFKEIPIIKLEVEEGLCIGNKIGNLCGDHFKLRTSLLHAENRSLYAMPYYKMGPEFDSQGNSTSLSEDESRGNRSARIYENRGFAVIGPTDEVGFMEPKGAAYDLANTQLKELADEIHRVVHQMSNSVKAQSSALGRSGSSKEMDNHSTEILLNEYGHYVKEFAKKIYFCISNARNENIRWNPIGLDSFQMVDKDQLVREASAFNSIINIPSATFNKAHLNQLAMAFAPNVSPEVMLQIKNEIEEHIDAEGHSLVEIKRNQTLEQTDKTHANNKEMFQAKQKRFEK